MVLVRSAARPARKLGCTCTNPRRRPPPVSPTNPAPRADDYWAADHGSDDHGAGDHGARRARRTAAALALALLLTACSSLNPFKRSEPLPEDPQALYELGQRHYSEQRWEAAERAFERLWKDHADSPLAADARFYEAECRYSRGKYDGAFELYKKFVSVHPLTPHAPTIQKRLWDMGTFTLEGGRGATLGLFSHEQEGIDVLDYLVTAFPNGDLADDALYRAAQYELGHRDELSAITHLHDLVDYYPTSEWAMPGQLALARAYRAVNRGTSYDADALLRAAAEYDTYIAVARAQPGAGGMSEADLASARAELADVRRELAAKRLESGDYYARTGKPDAARAEWRNVIREHPDSEAARIARERLGETVTRPEPPQSQGPTRPDGAPATPTAPPSSGAAK